MKVVCEETLDRFRTAGKCEMCLLWSRVREPHHCFAKGQDSGRRLDVSFNLIALGSSSLFRCSCHTKIHAGIISRAEVLDVVSRRENLPVEDIENAVHRMRRAPRECGLCPRCGGKGTVVTLASALRNDGQFACAVCLGSGIIKSSGEAWIED